MIRPEADAFAFAGCARGAVSASKVPHTQSSPEGFVEQRHMEFVGSPIALMALVAKK